jgi:CheY-like chemotaxis protein
MLIGDLPIDVIVDVNQEVPSHFLGDVKRLRQVLMNIIANAAKYTKKGSISLRVIEANKSLNNHVIRFEVQDTGIGIAPAAQAKVFEFYERADSDANDAADSHGMGLAISLAIVNLMGGSIGLESVVDEGSKFYFEIPLEITQPISSEPSPQLLELTKSKDWKVRKILIAEDSISSCRLLEIILRKLGHNVVAVVNGAEAVAAAGLQRFDFIILDLQMPVMGGREAAKKIRSMGDQVGSKTIIALTANCFAEDREGALAVGFDRVITKPFEQSVLVDVISQLGN